MQNKDKIILFEGNAFAAMSIREALENSNISAFGNESISGGFDPNLKAQILVNETDLPAARKILNEVLGEIEKQPVFPETSEEDMDFKSEPGRSEIKSEDTEVLPYAPSIWLFSLLYVSTFGIYILYWFYRQWIYIKQKDTSRYLVPPLIAVVLMVLFNFQLHRSIYELRKKKDDLHDLFSVIFPFSYFLCLALINAPYEEIHFVFPLSFISFLPIVYEIQGLSIRKNKITISPFEVFLFAAGVVTWISIIYYRYFYYY